MNVEEELTQYYDDKVSRVLPFEIKSALMDYSLNSYAYIREVLSGHTNLTIESIRGLKKDIKLIRKAFTYSTLPMPITVYHGSDVKWFNEDDKSIKPTSFFSTSLSEKVGVQFVGFPHDEGSLIKINIPAGNPFIWMKPLSFHTGEQEILLDLDSEFEVVDKKNIVDEHNRHYELIETNVKSK